MNQSDKIDRMIEVLTTSIIIKLDNDNITSVDKVELFFESDTPSEGHLRFDCLCDFTSEHLHNQIAASIDCFCGKKLKFNIKKLEKRIAQSIKEYLKEKDGTTN